MKDEKDLIEESADALAEAEEKAEETAEEAAGLAEEAAGEATDEADDESPAETNEEDEQPEEADDNANIGKKILGDVAEIVESTLITVFVIVMIFTYLLHPVNVMGHSMMPTLNDNDKIFMTTVYGKLEYGDIVIINNDAVYSIDENGSPREVQIDANPLNECIIKRVIASGGQEINIDNSSSDPKEWFVTVDGEKIDEPYVMENAITSPTGEFYGRYPFTVPDGYYFVMGDNRENSSDSRNSLVGLIKKDQIYGKAIMKYSPFSEFKFLWNSYK